MKCIRTYTIILLSLAASLSGQNTFTIHKDLVWDTAAYKFTSPNGTKLEGYHFTNAVYLNQSPETPHFLETFDLPGNTAFTTRIVSEQYEIVDNPIAAVLQSPEFISPNITVSEAGQRNIGKIFFNPFRRNASGQVEKLVSFDLVIATFKTEANASNRGPSNTYNSILEDGEIFKFFVNKTGLCKLDYGFLKNDLKIDIDKIDPRNIKIFGNGGFMLPQSNNEDRADDLIENGILVSGEDDGKFDAGDFIMLNALGSDQWTQKGNGFSMSKNIYDDKSYYYLKIAPDKGKRLAQSANIESTDYSTNTGNVYDRYEKDETNLLARSKPTSQGGGKLWFGDYFFSTREKSFSNLFQFNKLIKTDTLYLRAGFAARSSNNSYFEILMNNKSFRSTTISGVNIGDIENGYANGGSVNTSTFVSDDNLSVTVKFPQNGTSSEGWLDYIEVNGRAELSLSTNKSLYFRDLRSTKYATTSFTVKNASAATQIWDITIPNSPKLQATKLTGSDLTFGTATSTLRQFVAFSANDAFQKATAVGKIAQQNLHGIDKTEMVIVYHKSFEKQANQLAAYRKNTGLTVVEVDVDKVYNEFSSGAQDPTAIRDFARMLFERSPTVFRYLLLFGDGSFDYKGLMNPSNNSNFIPAYETDQSFAPIEAYPTDDYYALLTANEGAESFGSLKGALDISVGRLTVTTADEAQDVVDKIIRYETNPSTLGDWRNRIAFVGDDEDGNLHTSQVDGIANKVNSRKKVFNQDKVYFDATQRIVSSGGARFPFATEQLNRNVDDGVLTVNYLGHGGPTAWAQERVLTINDINSWSNSNKLPLFITATCSFAGYDDPSRLSAGEQIFLKSNGGGIALFSTVRAVYAHSNERLTNAVFDTIYGRQNNQALRLGDILRIGKNTNSTDTIDSNSRKFTLLGDPALRLAMPRFNIVTSKIREVSINPSKPDTIKAFQKVAVEGYIAQDDGSLYSSFNGTVFVTLYDKAASTKTLGQGDQNSPYNFTIQKTILFKGTATVAAGKFKVVVVVPKDIDYKYGLGKLSFYASNGKLVDAAGFHELIIGGTDANIPNDNKGPVVNVFLNDDKFIFGGTTDQNPLLFVTLADENGINLSNASVGHDLVATLDNNAVNALILNQYYEPYKDDFTKGELRYPLKDLAEGRHSIKIKAWDTVNNSGEGTTEFVVSSSAVSALDQVLNYPNPFTTRTEFQFKHRYPGQLMDIQIQIFTVSGALVKTLITQQSSDGNLIRGIEWDGRDDFGDQLAKGVYIYKVAARLVGSSNTGISDSNYEKLVILR